MTAMRSTFKRRSTLLASCSLLLLLAGCGVGNKAEPPMVASPVESMGVVSPIADSIVELAENEPISAEVIAARMESSLSSTPVLHITVRNRHMGVAYECQGWMMAGKVKGEVRRDGKLVFASFTDGHRVQEFVPRVKFANGSEGHNVFIEHDPAPGGWFHLVDVDFTCGPGAIAISPYLADDGSESIAKIHLGNMERSKMTDTSLNGRACYWFHLSDPTEGTLHVTWDLYVDKLTCEPVRQSRLMVSNGKTLKDDVFDYTFEHLANDEGIRWGLDATKLRESN